MIQLDEKTAIEVEKAAIKSIEQYGDQWKKFSKDDLRKKRSEILEQLSAADNLPIAQILESPASAHFLKFCVELSVIKTLLTSERSYDLRDSEGCGHEKPQIHRDSPINTP